MSGEPSIRARKRRRAANAGGVGAVVAALSFGAAHPALAQAARPADRNGAIEQLKQHDQTLDKLRDAQRKTQETEAALKREIENLGSDRRKLNQDLLDTAARLRNVEAGIAATQARLKPLDEKEAAIRRSLDGRQAVIAEILAALQRMGRRPPPALIARPEDALQSVRTAMLLGAVLPEMRNEARALASDLAALVDVRKNIDVEQNRLKGEVAALDKDRLRIAALVEARQKQQADREKSLDDERARAAALAREAESLQDLIAKLETSLDSAARAARAAARIDANPALAVARDPGRLSPAVAFASLRGHIPIPVNGVKIRDFGAPDSVGGAEKGLSIATRAGAQVTAPADGWVVYAGPFRSYGQLLILNAGGGYHILLAGMERISVDLGQFVLAGEPVAAMGNSSHIAAILATGSSQPVLYVEFRKNGTPFDPGPWWAAGEAEKVRG